MDILKEQVMGGRRFMNRIEPGSALWRRQLAQWAHPPKVPLEMRHIYWVRNPIEQLAQCARMIAWDIMQHKPHVYYQAMAETPPGADTLPLFVKFIEAECYKARHRLGAYADIV